MSYVVGCLYVVIFVNNRFLNLVIFLIESFFWRWGQWSDQEPISSQLVMGKSPAGYWSTVIGILLLYDIN